MEDCSWERPRIVEFVVRAAWRWLLAICSSWPRSSRAGARALTAPGRVPPTPGTAPLGHQQVSPATSGLSPFTTITGSVYMSVDAFGTNDPAGGPIKVHKNNASTTVEAAYLMAASTGESGYTPVDGDVTLNGTSVTWDPSETIPNGISSENVFADVTSIVKPVIDADGPGDISLTVAEPNNSESIDGEVLAVVLQDPTLPSDNTVSLLYGALSTTGDNYNIGLATPIDKSNPNLALTMSIGDSYGYQGPPATGQYSQIDVDGSRLTTSAGGNDDSACKYDSPPDFADCGNGELITAGGVGDSTANPSKPKATDITCKPGPPTCDDELYNLLPFVNNGDTSIDVNTLNPSNDDNIFFSGFELDSEAAVVGEGIVLTPVSSTDPAGGTHTLTAKVQDTNGNPIPNTVVTFNVLSGPNAGTTGTGTTDPTGTTTFTYSGTGGAGVDTIEASFVAQDGSTITSNSVTETWTQASTDKKPPTCAFEKVINGPPETLVVSFDDNGSGLGSIAVVNATNATATIPTFTPGRVRQSIRLIKTDPSQGSSIEVEGTDVAGNTHDCTFVFFALTAKGTQTMSNIAPADNTIDIMNFTLPNLTYTVNGVTRSVHLRTNQNRTVRDARVFNLPSNTFSVTSPCNGVADVVIWDGSIPGNYTSSANSQPTWCKS
jgi:hypothetical protein